MLSEEDIKMLVRLHEEILKQLKNDFRITNVTRPLFIYALDEQFLPKEAVSAISSNLDEILGWGTSFRNCEKYYEGCWIEKIKKFPLALILYHVRQIYNNSNGMDVWKAVGDGIDAQSTFGLILDCDSGLGARKTKFLSCVTEEYGITRSYRNKSGLILNDDILKALGCHDNQKEGNKASYDYTEFFRYNCPFLRVENGVGDGAGRLKNNKLILEWDNDGLDYLMNMSWQEICSGVNDIKKLCSAIAQDFIREHESSNDHFPGEANHLCFESAYIHVLLKNAPVEYFLSLKAITSGDETELPNNVRDCFHWLEPLWNQAHDKTSINLWTDKTEQGEERLLYKLRGKSVRFCYMEHEFIWKSGTWMDFDALCIPANILPSGVKFPEIEGVAPLVFIRKPNRYVARLISPDQYEAGESGVELLICRRICENVIVVLEERQLTPDCVRPTSDSSYAMDVYQVQEEWFAESKHEVHLSIGGQPFVMKKLEGMFLEGAGLLEGASVFGKSSSYVVDQRGCCVHHTGTARVVENDSVKVSCGEFGDILKPQKTFAHIRYQNDNPNQIFDIQFVPNEWRELIPSIEQVLAKHPDYEQNYFKSADRGHTFCPIPMDSSGDVLEKMLLVEIGRPSSMAYWSNGSEKSFSCLNDIEECKKWCMLGQYSGMQKACAAGSMVRLMTKVEDEVVTYVPYGQTEVYKWLVERQWIQQEHYNAAKLNDGSRMRVVAHCEDQRQILFDGFYMPVRASFEVDQSEGSISFYCHEHCKSKMHLSMIRFDNRIQVLHPTLVCELPEDNLVSHEHGCYSYVLDVHDECDIECSLMQLDERKIIQIIHFTPNSQNWHSRRDWSARFFKNYNIREAMNCANCKEIDNLLMGIMSVRPRGGGARPMCIRDISISEGALNYVLEDGKTLQQRDNLVFYQDDVNTIATCADFLCNFVCAEEGKRFDAITEFNILLMEVQLIFKNASKNYTKTQSKLGIISFAEIQSPSVWRVRGAASWILQLAKYNYQKGRIMLARYLMLAFIRLVFKQKSPPGNHILSANAYNCINAFMDQIIPHTLCFFIGYAKNVRDLYPSLTSIQ